MATDPIREYLDAKKAYDEATKKAEGFVHAISRTGLSLPANWRATLVSGVSGFPPAMIGSRNVIGSADLPTIQELGSALVGWHQAVRVLLDAWRQVPLEDQYGLQPPPKDAK